MNIKGVSKLGVFLLIGVLVLVLPFLGAKNFIIRNASDSTQSYFMVNGTDGVVTASQVNLGNVTINGDLSAVDFNISNNLYLGNGTIWYNSSDNKYYYYNRSTWLVFDVEKEQNATIMGLHNPDYDSGWVQINASQELILNHGLNTESTMVTFERNESELELRNGTEGLVLLMHMNGIDGYNTNGTADATGRHVFNFSGGAHFDTDDYRFGGSSLKLNNESNDYLQIPESEDFAWGNSSFTISFWIKSNQANLGMVYGYGSGVAAPFKLYSSSGKIRPYISSGTGYGYDFKTAINDGVWHYVAITRPMDGYLYEYVDGGLDATYSFDNANSISGSDVSVTIGSDFASGYFLNGSVDELAVYRNRSLTSAEVLEHYQNSKYIYLAEKNSSDIKLVRNPDDFVSTTARVKMWKEGVIEGNFSGNLVVNGNLSVGSRITFALSETIDNLIDGWLRVTGGLNVTMGNLSLGNGNLWNDNGTLKWGDTTLESTNISIMYGANESGQVNPLKTTNSGVLKLSVTSLKSEIWEIVGGVTQLVTAGNLNISGILTVYDDANITGNLNVGGDVNVSGNLQVVGNITGGSPVKIVGGLAVSGDVTSDLNFANGTGINFGNATMMSYEEGSFVPILSGGYASPTYTSQGAYIKIGKLVYFRILVTISGGTRNSDGLSFSGLPYVAENTDPFGGYWVYQDMINGALPLIYVAQGNSVVTFYISSSTGPQFLGTDLTDATGNLRIAGTYIAAS